MAMLSQPVGSQVGVQIKIVSMGFGRVWTLEESVDTAMEEVVSVAALGTHGRRSQ